MDTNMNCNFGEQLTMFESAPNDNQSNPIDVTSIVHCRDCIYYRESEIAAPNKFCFRLLDRQGQPIGYNWNADDFCSHGVRKVKLS